MYVVICVHNSTQWLSCLGGLAGKSIDSHESVVGSNPIQGSLFSLEILSLM